MVNGVIVVFVGTAGSGKTTLTGEFGQVFGRKRKESGVRKSRYWG